MIVTFTHSFAGLFQHDSQFLLFLVFIHSLISVAKPSSANLRVIRWKNERGEVKKFHLKSKMFHKWRRIGDLVASRQQVEVWSREMNSEQCCDAVLSQWLDHPPRRYPATWEGLCELLDDCELGEVASELKLAVSNAV